MKASKAAALVAAVAASVGIAACGGGGGGNGSSSSGYIAQADKICRANPTPTAGPTKTAAQAAALYEAVVKVRQRVLNQLERLNPPSDLQPVVQQYLGRLRAVIHDDELVVVSARRANVAAYDAFSTKDGIDNFERSLTAQRIGYKVCGTSAKSAPDPQLERQADTICARVDQAFFQALPSQPSGYPVPLTRVARAYDAQLPDLRASIGQLRALQPSGQLRGAYAQFLNAYANRVQITDEESKAAHAHNPQRLTALNKQDEVAVKPETAAANKLGFTVCGQTGTNGD